MSTVKSKKLQVGTDASASNNFTIYQPSTPDGTLRIGVGNADSPTEVARFDSVPSYSAKAWVNFNGTGTVAIRSSGNVSSITDNGTGDYTVNFITAMPDVNYNTVCGFTGVSGSNGVVFYPATQYVGVQYNAAYITTSSIRGIAVTGGGASLDVAFLCISVFR